MEDEYGNKFSTGNPGGEGSLSCCEVLKGHRVKVTWSYSHMTVQDYVEGKPEQIKEAWVEMPPISDLPTGSKKMRIFEVHVFPDEHVELALTEEIFGRVRFPQYEAVRQLLQDSEIDGWRQNFENNKQSFHRVLYGIAGVAYRKYSITNIDDLEQYIKMALRVSPTFDTHPIISPLLHGAKEVSRTLCAIDQGAYTVAVA